jgi:hypothetical protein
MGLLLYIQIESFLIFVIEAKKVKFFFQMNEEPFTYSLAVGKICSHMYTIQNKE